MPERCPDHSGIMAMLQQHDRNIEDIYTKQTAMQACISELQTRAQEQFTELRFLIKDLTGSVKRLEDMIANSLELSQQRAKCHAEDMRAIDKRLDAVENYSWFGRVINASRDRIFSWVVVAAAAISGYIFVVEMFRRMGGH